MRGILLVWLAAVAFAQEPAADMLTFENQIEDPTRILQKKRPL